MYQSRLGRTVTTVLLTGVLSGSVISLSAQAPPAQAPPAKTPPATQTPPDNTKVNTRDRAEGAVTADQQKENATDRTLTQKIRRAIMAEKGLSTYAKNVKIVSQGGNVTLKGPVRSADEKATIAAKAVEIAGATNVSDEMTVAPGDTKPVKK